MSFYVASNIFSVHGLRVHLINFEFYKASV